jgi:riboflavin kinase/FMN adenylyltransferase
MSDNKKLSVIIALGYFDSVHIGHRAVMQTCVQKSLEQGVVPAVFSFSGNLRKIIGGADDKFVYDTDQRKAFINGLGIKEVLFAPTSKEFLGMDRTEFLDYLNSVYDIKGYVTGEDYRFGYKGLGDLQYLKEYAKTQKQMVFVVPAVTLYGERVSTTGIKKLLLDGEIKKANEYLGRPFSVTGTVCQGRKVGRTIDFPTANIQIPFERATLKNGVYAGYTEIDGKRYTALINYGARPTFGLSDKLVEAHILDFNGDLYEKSITLFFTSYLRDIKKFDDEKALKTQLEKDLVACKGSNL